MPAGDRDASAGTGGTGGTGGGEEVAFPCVAWAPRAAPWSNLPAVARANVDTSLSAGWIRPSATGHYLYTIAVWLEGGGSRRQIVRSEDLGATWCLVASEAPITDVIPAPRTELVLYAVTLPLASGKRELLRTTDGGATWSVAPGGLPDDGPATSDQLVVGADPDVVWFAGQTAWHLTRDGGSTWSAIAPPWAGARVFVDTAQPNRLFVPKVDESQSRVSTDWGKTWTTFALPPFNACVGSWPFDCGFSIDTSSVLYRGNAVVSDIGVVMSVDVWRSDDWARTWTQVPTPSLPFYGVPSPLGSHVPGALFVPSQRGLLGSVDGGVSWNQVAPSNFWKITAATARALIGQDDAGLVTSTDGGAIWHRLPRVQVPASLAVSPVAPYPLWGNGAGLRSDDGGATWYEALAKSRDVMADGADANVAYATFGQMMRTEDGGATWEPIPSPTEHPASLLAACPAPRSCLFVLDSTTGSEVMVRSDDHGRTWRAPTRWTNWDTRSPVVVSPDDPDRLLQGRSDAIYETGDGGQTWNYHPLGLAVVGIAFLSPTEAIAVSDQRQVLHSSDGGVTWTVPSGETPAGRARRLVQSTRRPRTLFILTGDPKQPLFRSDDGGTTAWTGIGALGDQQPGDAYSNPFVTDVVDLGQGFLAIVNGYGLASFE